MNCKNCENQLQHHAQFCNSCGARVIEAPFTFRYITQDFEERYLNLDRNLLVRTIRDMFLRPESVIKGYINGVRKRHLNLANFLAVAITASGLLIFALQKFFPNALDLTWMIDPNSEAFKENPFFQNMDPDDPFKGMWWMEYQAALYILAIPIYALFAKITFLNQKAFSYLKHMVIVGYTQSFMSIVLAIPTLIFLAFGFNYLKMSYWIILFMFFFSAYVYKRLFGLSLLQIIGRSLLFLLVGLGLYIVFIILVVLVTIGIKMALG